MSSGNRWIWLILGCVLAVAVLKIATRPDEPMVAEVAEAEPERVALDCQKIWDLNRLDLRPTVVESGGVQQERVDTLLSGPGRTQNIPEFHDCQRLLLRDEPKSELQFGPVVAVWAVPREPARLEIDWTDAAGFGQRVYEDAGAQGQGLPAAQIYASEAYKPLKLKKGFSCLYLVKSPARGWQAYTRSDERGDPDCSQPLGSGQMRGPGWDTLDVVIESLPSAVRPRDVPMVARLMWSDTLETYRIGVWCDYGWCSVGRGSAGQGSYYSRHMTGSGKVMPERRSYDIKAWYDQQILAVDRGGGVLEPSDYVGTVFPAVELGEHKQDTFDNNRWRLAAEVSVLPRVARPETNPFAEKLGLHRTNPEGPFNQIHLCNGDSEKCGIPGDKAANCDSRWWARIDPPEGGASQLACITRCPYDVRIPGTVRWRWLEWDPGIWMRCVNGCCELTGIL